MPPHKQKEKARETMDIYAPIAQRLGISKVKIELDDLSLKYLKPDVYYDLVKKSISEKVKENFCGRDCKEVRQHIENAGIHAQIDGRVKHFSASIKRWSIRIKHSIRFYDLFAVRIIVDTVRDCYACLGIIHEMYKPVQGVLKTILQCQNQICISRFIQP